MAKSLARSAGRAGRECGAKFIGAVLAAVVAFLAAAEAPAQTNAPGSRPPANRYLLIVETSRAMQRRTNGLLNAVNDLLGSGINGQLRPGDSIGLWTYNHDLHAGAFPLQKWTPATRTAVTQRISEFVQAQKFERQPKFEKVWPSAEGVIRNCEFLTIILFSTGTEEIRGTSVDAQVNRDYQTWRAQQEEARMPFVTVFRAKRGAITDWAVSQAPWTIEVPPLPPELKVTEASRRPAPATVAAPPEPRPAPLAPLIISGHKPAPQPVPVTAGPGPSVSSGQTEPHGPSQSSSQSAPATSALAPHESSPPAPLPAATATVQAPASSPAQPISVPAAVTAHSSEGAVSPTAEEAAPELARGTNQTHATGNVIAAMTHPKTSAAPPGRAFLSGKVLWIAGAGLAVVFVFIWLVLRARARAPLHISLITESLDRKK